jgi:serine/threonine-protein kinase
MDTEFLPLQDALAGEYSFERELGRGGMGVVYLARDVQLDRPVAIKVLPAALAARDDVRARFLREARTAANLSHPNIVPIHRVGELAGIPFFVMAFVDGPTLGERLRDRGPTTASTVSQILRDVAQALGYAHSRGIVHRDIKPDNILLDTATGRAMVTDFGIAAVSGETGEGPVSGTAGFISPEQLVGLPADGRSDLYSLGVVAHLALTGTMPDETASTVPASAEVSASLATAIARCLAPDPNHRFADAESLVAALDATTAVTRSSLPPELRAWAGDQVPMLPLYGFLSFTGFGSAIVATLSSLGGGLLDVPALAYFSLSMATLPGIPVVAYQLRKTQRALAAGYRLSDLRFALRAWESERRAELDRAGAIEKRWVRIASRIPLLSALVYMGGASLIVLQNPGPSTVLTAVAVGNLSVFVGIVSLASLSVFGLPLIPRSLHRRMIGRVRSWLWNSRFGNWLAERLAPKGGGVPLAAFRPTEMALEVAIDDLYAALPDEYRDSLQDLPAIARRLTARATELREAVAMGSNAGADSTAPDQAWEKVKGANAARLKETVTALERLRLGLLRLHGGLADLQPVTTALEAARAIDWDVTRLVDGQAEVSGVRRLLSFERRSPSPA